MSEQKEKPKNGLTYEQTDSLVHTLARLPYNLVAPIIQFVAETVKQNNSPEKKP